MEPIIAIQNNIYHFYEKTAPKKFVHTNEGEIEVAEKLMAATDEQAIAAGWTPTESNNIVEFLVSTGVGLSDPYQAFGDMIFHPVICDWPASEDAARTKQL